MTNLQRIEDIERMNGGCGIRCQRLQRRCMFRRRVALSARKVGHASGSLRGWIGGQCSQSPFRGSNFEIGRD